MAKPTYEELVNALTSLVNEAAEWNEESLAANRRLDERARALWRRVDEARALLRAYWEGC